MVERVVSNDEAPGSKPGFSIDNVIFLYTNILNSIGIYANDMNVIYKISIQKNIASYELRESNSGPTAC